MNHRRSPRRLFRHPRSIMTKRASIRRRALLPTVLLIGINNVQTALQLFSVFKLFDLSIGDVTRTTEEMSGVMVMG